MSQTSRRTFRFVSATAACIGVLTLAACQSMPKPSPITLALTATSSEPAFALTGQIRDLVTDYARQAHFPTDATVNIVIQGQPNQTLDITPMRGSEVEAESSKAATAINAHLLTLDTAIGDLGAGSDGLNPFEVYARAVDITPPGGTIVMVTSGVSTANPTDLNKAGNWISQPEEFVAQVDPADIPDASGLHVVFAGLGYPDGTHQAAPPTAAKKALTTLWLGLCEASGASSCTTIPGPVGSGAPTATNSVPLVVFSETATPCMGTVTISSDIAFGGDSYVLTDAADALLKPIADKLKTCPPGTPLNAYGHTAQIPSGADGINLATNRAQAVLDRLNLLGAPADTLGNAIGYGSVSHQIVDNMPGGRFDEELAKQNRVVELVFMTP